MKKQIIINEAHASAIQSALDDVNGKASAFTTHRAFDVIALASRFVADLVKADIPTSDRAGAILVHVGAGPWANAYRSEAIATRITLRVASDGREVRLVDVERATVHPKKAEKFEISLRMAAHDHYVGRCIKRFGVINAKDYGSISFAA